MAADKQKTWKLAGWRRSKWWQIGTQGFSGFELRGIVRGCYSPEKTPKSDAMVKAATASISGLATGTVKPYPS
ncbi:hypothetical protein GOBAR_DD00449 [Gossypium barbadense]|nr:hypothetical protein GOBAR_DD00449 [Gossypium barbadense]